MNKALQLFDNAQAPSTPVRLEPNKFRNQVREFRVQLAEPIDVMLGSNVDEGEAVCVTEVGFTATKLASADYSDLLGDGDKSYVSTTIELYTSEQSRRPAASFKLGVALQQNRALIQFNAGIGIPMRPSERGPQMDRSAQGLTELIETLRGMVANHQSFDESGFMTTWIEMIPKSPNAAEFLADNEDAEGTAAELPEIPEFNG